MTSLRVLWMLVRSLVAAQPLRANALLAFLVCYCCADARQSSNKQHDPFDQGMLPRRKIKVKVRF